MIAAALQTNVDADQARWLEIFAHLHEIVTLLDAEGRMTYTTPSVFDSLGLNPDDLLGQPLGARGHPDDATTVKAAFAHCLGTGETGSVTHRVQARDASWRTLESKFVCLRREPAAPTVLVVSRDVTEQAALERERDRLELDRRVSHRLEAVGQLSAGIAHEINTPLQFVGDSVTFLRAAVDELLTLTGQYRDCLYTDAPIPVEERRRAMRAAEEEADVDYLCQRIPAAFARTSDGIARVRSIVFAMKRFSHTSSTELAPADLNDAIRTTLAVCRNEYKYVADVVENLGELPHVVCNVGELNQVFLNLILNAAQAIETDPDRVQERGTIQVSTWLDGGEAVVEVADDGPGIPAEIQERIYEPFFTTKEVGKGTGQGLALARAAVERHSGSLSCHSTPGHGTVFTIRLPLAPRPSAPAGKQAA